MKNELTWYFCTAPHHLEPYDNQDEVLSMPLALKTALWKSLLSTLWFEFPNFQELSTVSPNRWIIPVSSSSALKMILTVFHHHSHWLWFPLFELNPKFGLGCGRKIGNEGWKWRSATMTLLSVFRLCKGTCQKRFSGFCPLWGGGYPPFPLRKKSFFFSHWFSVKGVGGGGGPPPFR